MASQRWLIVLAGVLMQMCLGAIYGWSVFVLPLSERFGWTRSQVTLAFSIALLAVGAGTIVGGNLQDRRGPRLVATLAGLFYGLGYLLTGTANTLTELYLWYGAVAGFGMGMGYIVPVATLIKWFPDKRGLISGLAVAGFGAGALVMSPIAAASIQARGVAQTFYILGTLYLVVVTLAAQLFRNPPEGWSPPGWQPTPRQQTTRAMYNYTVGEALRTSQFWLLFLILFLNVSAGIMIISQASPMGQEILGLSQVGAAALVVGTISVFNTIGRIFWSWLSDTIGRRQVFIAMFLLQAVLFALLPSTRSLPVFLGAVALIALCYGGGFGTMPSFTADYFGTRYVGGIYGIILLAWSLASVWSPLLIARVRELTGSYAPALYIMAGVMLAAVLIPLLIRPPVYRAATQQGG